jgi:hypothetical protein
LQNGVVRETLACVGEYHDLAGRRRDARVERRGLAAARQLDEVDVFVESGEGARVASVEPSDTTTISGTRG